MKLISTLILLLMIRVAAFAQCDCGPVGDLLNGTRDTVGSVDGLRAAIAGANGPTAIYLRDGEYALTGAVTISRPGIIIRSLSGNRGGVVITGIALSPDSAAFRVTEGNFTLADLTVRGMASSAVVIDPGHPISNLLLHNVDFQDAGTTLVRADGTALADAGNGIVECCRFGYSASKSRNQPVYGIRVNGGTNWSITNSVFEDIASASEPVPVSTAIVVTGGAGNIQISRNRITGCDLGMFVGDSTSFTTFVENVIVGNNFITGGFGDGGGMLFAAAQGVTIQHNSVYRPGTPKTGAITIRYPQSFGVSLYDNLTDNPTVLIDVIGVLSSGNYDHITATSFVDVTKGDLHLRAGSPAIDIGSQQASSDIDCAPVTDGRPDVGADEFVKPASVDGDEDASPLQCSYSGAERLIRVHARGGVEVTAEMIDITGRIVFHGACRGDAVLPVPGIAPGAYILVVRGARGEMAGRKIIVGR
ncbi:MAG: hypothetical protein JWQ98_2592 [Chlorobi bacterium]|nr:hypothetical protein [Chlorobiota bacterium]